MVVFATIAVAVCSSCSGSEEGDQEGVTSETTEKIVQAQDANVELEEIDGTLDSLINAIP